MDTIHGIGKFVVVGPVGNVKPGTSLRTSSSYSPPPNGPSSAQENTRLPVWSTALEREPKPR